MKSKTLLVAVAAATLVTCGARAGLYTYNNSGSPFSGGTISDGNPAGAVFSATINDANITAAGNLIGGVQVTLNLSGGYNGDLYSYLVSPNGTTVVLMNRPGTAPFYAPGSGMSVTLWSGASTSIQSAAETAGQTLTGTYQAAGNLDNFGTMTSQGGAANGTWTLFFADLSLGGGNETLTGWSLDLTVVPEPVPLALALSGSLVGAGSFLRWCRYRRQTNVAATRNPGFRS